MGPPPPAPPTASARPTGCLSLTADAAAAASSSGSPPDLEDGDGDDVASSVGLQPPAGRGDDGPADGPGPLLATRGHCRRKSFESDDEAVLAADKWDEPEEYLLLEECERLLRRKGTSGLTDHQQARLAEWQKRFPHSEKRHTRRQHPAPDEDLPGSPSLAATPAVHTDARTQSPERPQSPSDPPPPKFQRLRRGSVVPPGAFPKAHPLGPPGAGPSPRPGTPTNAPAPPHV
eukprot:TRINITY_DN13685_c0_g1_i1.p2 TRINITY_DN13685_c0_g1~~TRINITY_DN13685_c0_g1_i1.p2  ORF type:complete len:232 (+),score=31.77 TRINITY_DN13685_c0_g1_i1:302-997(+)